MSRQNKRKALKEEINKLHSRLDAITAEKKREEFVDNFKKENGIDNEGNISLPNFKSMFLKYSNCDFQGKTFDKIWKALRETL